MNRSTLFVGFSLILISAVWAQSPSAKPTPEKDQIQLMINKIGHAPDGRLVLGIKIKAKASEDMRLAGPQEKPAFDQSAPPPQSFTLAGSFLTDVYSGKRYDALSGIPDKPYYGPFSVATVVNKGGWFIMGVAFPPIPAPPLDEKGNKQDYKLMLKVPLEAEPILVTFPVS